MAVLIIMPKQGNTVESCILTKWHKREGDAVKAGEQLFSYETDKSAFDEAAALDGTLLKLLCEEGDDIPVLQGVCVIGSPGEDISALLKDAKPQEEKPQADGAAVAAEITLPEAQDQTALSGEFKVSPRAKRLAKSMGLDAAQALPTGPMGRVIEKDIWALADGRKRPPQSAAPSGDYKDVPLSNIRKRIGESMHRSLSDMAQLTHHSSADATAILNLRARIKAAGGATTLNDMILFAVSRVLKQHKDMNAHFLGDKIRYFSGVNLGMAVDTDRGLMVPTLFGADQLTLEDITKQAKELAEKCRNGAISPDMLNGGTFTISNLGVLGVEMFTPVINPPQTGILGVCAIIDRPRKGANGYLEIYPAIGLSLTYDHRAVDGAPASRFLMDLRKALENFESLLAENKEA